MINQKIDFLKSILVTGEKFEVLLQELIEHYKDFHLFIRYVVEDKDSNKYVYGTESDRLADKTSYRHLADGYKVQISLWQNEDVVSIEQCEELFLAFWNIANCDSVSGLVATDREAIINKCNKTIIEWIKEKRKIAFLMLDLDNFSQVNKQYEHETGTGVISEFSRVIRYVLGKRGILIHQSGDEFNLLFSYNEPYEVVEVAYDMKVGVENHKFNLAPEIDLTMAIGIFLFEDEKFNFMQARNKAEEAYDGKHKNMDKQRDSIRINKKINEVNYGEFCTKLALTRIISNRKKNIFHNIFLDFLSEYASSKELGKAFQDEINRVLDWINPEFSTNIRCTKECKIWDTKADFSGIEVGLAVLHGILKNKRSYGKKVKCIIDKNQQASIKIQIDGADLFYKEGKESVINSIVWEDIVKDVAGFEGCTKKVVLLYAGYDSRIDIPEDIFYNIVRVDTRPSTGGALPDLWAAALCELISYMKDNSNFSDIIISGAVEHTKMIKDYLDNIKSWETKAGKYSIKYISKKTFMLESDIIDFKNRFGDHIFSIYNVKDMIDKLYDIYRNGFEICVCEKVVEEENNRFLDRSLAYNNIELPIIHGCKAQSIADAFPIVLEILRNAAIRNEGYIIDQAGRKLYELIDFRILLENPRSDYLPLYYKDDIDELKDYYSKTFEDNTGLFKKEFMKNNQLEIMIDHIKDAIIDSDKRYATRRAILVVPNGDSTQGKYPLGLISVWLAPRFIDENVVIDFSYTWRTVEALVGLPESMYASVKFAEELTVMIRERCRSEIKIEMGKLSYIAHSLHMFLEKESMNIIRGIINDASI